VDEPFIRKRRTRAAWRSVASCPSRQAKPGSTITPAAEAFVPPLVANRPHKGAAGRARSGPVTLEDLADERPLAGRVEVVRGPADRRLDRRLAEPRERPDGGDQDVAAFHEGANGLGSPGVGDHRFEAAELRRQRLQALGIAGRQHRPHTARGERPRRKLAHVARGTEEHDATRHGPDATRRFTTPTGR
jgi:hypothetical protein